MSKLHPLLLILLVFLLHHSGAEPWVSYDCDEQNCVDRPDYTVKAILHGSYSKSTFWKQVGDAMQQVGHDMRIRLEMEFCDGDFDDMAKKIRAAATEQDSSSLNALIVSIPTSSVRDAVQSVVDAGLPVFGVNSGYEYTIHGLMGHVAMDERLGGVKAAETIQQHWAATNNITETHWAISETNSENETIISIDDAPPSRRVLFVNHERGNEALDLRRQGLAETLENRQGNIFSKIMMGVQVVVEELVVSLEEDDAQSHLTTALHSCPFDAIVLAGGDLLEVVTNAYYTNKCNFEKQILGIFDTNSKIYDSIAASKLNFCVSQQQYLQASFAVTMATVFATTGKALLAHSSEAPFGNYQSGPKVITLSNLPTDTQQVCEHEAFPVCNDRSTSVGRCACKERDQIRIGGVLVDHGDFWLPIVEAARQGASDMGVTLILDPLDRADDFETENAKTAEKVKALCRDGVDGVFTTIKSEAVADAVRECQKLHVPVISLNSGAAFAQELGLTQHVSMDEYAAGYKAGQSFVEAGISYGYCVNWHIVNDLTPRCTGFKDAIEKSGDAIYVGVMAAPHDNVVLFQQALEANITHGGQDWDGVGVMLVSAAFLPAALVTTENHPGVVLGTIDESDEVHQALDDGLLLFTIDQVPYLQGYLPVVLLSWLAHTRQTLLSHFLETGPMLVQASPSEAESVCEANHFQVCPEPFNMNQLDIVRPIGLAVMAVIILTALSFIVWVVWNRKARIVRVSQPIFLIGICIGTITMASAILPYSLDDGVLSEDGGCVGCECPRCDVACMSGPWLMSVGFTIVFASLFSKIWRVNRLMTSGTAFRKLTLSSRDVMIPFVVLLGLNVIFLLVWTLADPKYWNRSRQCGSDDFTSYGRCMYGRGRTSVAMASSVFAVNLAAVVMANVQAYKARRYGTEFSESRYIALAMICILQVMVVVLPLIFLVRDNPPAHFFVTLGYIAAICLSVLLLIFVPKILVMRQPEPTSPTTTDTPQEEAMLPNDADHPNDTFRQGSSFRRSSASGLRIRKRYSYPSIVGGDASIDSPDGRDRLGERSNPSLRGEAEALNGDEDNNDISGSS